MNSSTRRRSRVSVTPTPSAPTRLARRENLPLHAATDGLRRLKMTAGEEYRITFR